jgi:hypothetical protein
MPLLAPALCSSDKSALLPPFVLIIELGAVGSDESAVGSWRGKLGDVGLSVKVGILVRSATGLTFVVSCDYLFWVELVNQELAALNTSIILFGWGACKSCGTYLTLAIFGAKVVG